MALLIVLIFAAVIIPWFLGELAWALLRPVEIIVFNPYKPAVAAGSFLS